MSDEDEGETFEGLSLENKMLWEKIRDGEKKYNDLIDTVNEIYAAVHNIYYAAYWTPDRNVDSEGLWTKLRDSMGFTPGKTKEVLGEKQTAPRVHVAEFPSQPTLDIRNTLMAILLNPDKAESIVRAILSKDVRISDLLTSLDIQ